MLCVPFGCECSISTLNSLKNTAKLTRWTRILWRECLHFSVQSLRSCSYRNCWVLVLPLLAQKTTHITPAHIKHPKKPTKIYLSVKLSTSCLAKNDLWRLDSFKWVFISFVEGIRWYYHQYHITCGGCILLAFILFFITFWATMTTTMMWCVMYCRADENSLTGPAATVPNGERRNCWTQKVPRWHGRGRHMGQEQYNHTGAQESESCTNTIVGSLNHA